MNFSYLPQGGRHQTVKKKSDGTQNFQKVAFCLPLNINSYKIDLRLTNRLKQALPRDPRFVNLTIEISKKSYFTVNSIFANL